MIKIIYIIFLLTSLSTFSQNNTFNDVLKASKVYFYGYDFTHFKFVEPKRMGQDAQIKGLIFEIIQLLNDKKTEKYYNNFFKKDTVIMNEEIVNALNFKIKAENILDFMKHSIPKDSLQTIINQYDTKGKTGIGFVQIIECFYRQKKETSVWYVFFDIATKKIIDAYETFNTDADSYHGLATYWEVGVSYGMGVYYAEHYKPAIKEFKK